MQQDKQRIMPAPDLDGAAAQECPRVSRGKDNFGEALRGDQTDDKGDGAHDALSTRRKAAVKPGPSAVSSSRPSAPARSARSSTNSTVAADMLP